MKQQLVKGKLFSILDIGASAVVAYGAVMRFGNPALWCIYIVEGCLSIYGFIRGIQISGNSGLVDVPKKMWNMETDNHAESGKLITSNSSSNSNLLRENINQSPISFNTKKGGYLIASSIYGIFAAVLMPSVQTIHYIHSSKRRWPPLINGGVLTYYALYLGSIYIGRDISLLLMKRMCQVLGMYGIVRGGYIAYQERPKKVFTLMWQGGMTSAHSPNQNNHYLNKLESTFSQLNKNSDETIKECSQNIQYKRPEVCLEMTNSSTQSSLSMESI